MSGLIKNVSQERYDEIDKERLRSNWFKAGDIKDNEKVKFRVLDFAIGFFQGWLKEGVRTGEDKDKPVRWGPDDEAPQYQPNEWDKGNFSNDPVSFIIAIPIWNFTMGICQILQITQSSIQTYLQEKQEEFKDLRKYDLELKKVVQNKRISYELGMLPGEQEDMVRVIRTEDLQNFHCDIDRLLTNEDPFDDSAQTLDLDFFMGSLSNEIPSESVTKAPVEKPAQTKEISEEDWRECPTKTGGKLGDLTQEQLILAKNTMVEKNQTDNPKYKFVLAGVRHYAQEDIKMASAEDDSPI